MTDTSPEALRALANCDARAGEPLGKALRAVAAEKGRWEARVAMLEDVICLVTEQRDTAARDARRAALEEVRKATAAIKDRSDVSSDAWTLTLVDAAIRALIDREPATEKEP